MQLSKYGSEDISLDDESVHIELPGLGEAKKSFIKFIDLDHQNTVFHGIDPNRKSDESFVNGFDIRFHEEIMEREERFKKQRLQLEQPQEEIGETKLDTEEQESELVGASVSNPDFSQLLPVRIETLKMIKDDFLFDFAFSEEDLINPESVVKFNIFLPHLRKTVANIDKLYYGENVKIPEALIGSKLPKSFLSPELNPKQLINSKGVKKMKVTIISIHKQIIELHNQKESLKRKIEENDIDSDTAEELEAKLAADLKKMRQKSKTVRVGDTISLLVTAPQVPLDYELNEEVLSLIPNPKPKKKAKAGRGLKKVLDLSQEFHWRSKNAIGSIEPFNQTSSMHSGLSNSRYQITPKEQSPKALHHRGDSKGPHLSRDIRHKKGASSQLSAQRKNLIQEKKQILIREERSPRGGDKPDRQTSLNSTMNSDQMKAATKQQPIPARLKKYIQIQSSKMEKAMKEDIYYSKIDQAQIDKNLEFLLSKDFEQLTGQDLANQDPAVADAFENYLNEQTQDFGGLQHLREGYMKNQRANINSSGSIGDMTASQQFDTFSHQKILEPRVRQAENSATHMRSGSNLDEKSLNPQQLNLQSDSNYQIGPRQEVRLSAKFELPNHKDSHDRIKYLSKQYSSILNQLNEMTQNNLAYFHQEFKNMKKTINQSKRMQKPRGSIFQEQSYPDKIRVQTNDSENANRKFSFSSPSKDSNIGLVGQTESVTREELEHQLKQLHYLKAQADQKILLQNKKRSHPISFSNEGTPLQGASPSHWKEEKRMFNQNLPFPSDQQVSLEVSPALKQINLATPQSYGVKVSPQIAHSHQTPEGIATTKHENIPGRNRDSPFIGLTMGQPSHNFERLQNQSEEVSLKERMPQRRKTENDEQDFATTIKKPSKPNSIFDRSNGSKTSGPHHSRTMGSNSEEDTTLVDGKANGDDDSEEENKEEEEEDLSKRQLPLVEIRRNEPVQLIDMKQSGKKKRHSRVERYQVPTQKYKNLFNKNILRDLRLRLSNQTYKNAKTIDTRISDEQAVLHKLFTEPISVTPEPPLKHHKSPTKSNPFTQAKNSIKSTKTHSVINQSKESTQVVREEEPASSIENRIDQHELIDGYLIHNKGGDTNSPKETQTSVNEIIFKSNFRHSSGANTMLTTGIDQPTSIQSHPRASFNQIQAHSNLALPWPRDRPDSLPREVQLSTRLSKNLSPSLNSSVLSPHGNEVLFSTFAQIKKRQKQRYRRMKGLEGSRPDESPGYAQYQNAFNFFTQQKDIVSGEMKYSKHKLKELEDLEKLGLRRLGFGTVLDVRPKEGRQSQMRKTLHNYFKDQKSTLPELEVRHRSRMEGHSLVARTQEMI